MADSALFAPLIARLAESGLAPAPVLESLVRFVPSQTVLEAEGLLPRLVEEWRAILDRLDERAAFDPETAPFWHEIKRVLSVGDVGGARDQLTRYHSDTILVMARVTAERAALHHLQRDFKTAASLFAATAALLPDTEIDTRWRLRLAEAEALIDFGSMSGSLDPIYAAAARLRGLAPDQNPGAWAEAHNHLGVGFARLGEHLRRGDILIEASNAFRRALTIQSQNEGGIDHAMTLNNLGNALRTAGDWLKKPDLVSEAVHAFKSALGIVTIELSRPHHLTMQFQLANCLFSLGRSRNDLRLVTDSERLYGYCVQQRDPATEAFDWANALYGQGAALAVIGENGGGVAALKAALRALDACLTVTLPPERAQTTALRQNLRARVAEHLGRVGGAPPPNQADFATALRQSLHFTPAAAKGETIH